MSELQSQRLILADNQTIYLAGLARVLVRESDFAIVARCGDQEQLYRVASSVPGCVVIFGSTLRPELARLMSLLFQRGSRAIAILESSESQRPYADAYVHGLLFRSATGADLVKCTRRVMRGDRQVYATGDLQELAEKDAAGARVRDLLSPREIQIVGLIAQGCRNKEIANRLDTTEQVVKNYSHGIYNKVGVSDRLELGLFTIQHPVLARAAAAAATDTRILTWRLQRPGRRAGPAVSKGGVSA